MIYQKQAALNRQQTVFLEKDMYWNVDETLGGVQSVKLPWGVASMFWQVAEESDGATFALVPAQLELTHRGAEATVLAGNHHTGTQLYQASSLWTTPTGRLVVNAMGYLTKKADALALKGIQQQFQAAVEQQRANEEDLVNKLASTMPISYTQIAVVDNYGGAITICGPAWFGDRGTAGLEFRMRDTRQLVTSAWQGTEIAGEIAKRARIANGIQAEVLQCHTEETRRQKAQRAFTDQMHMVQQLCQQFIADQAKNLWLPAPQLLTMTAPWMENIHEVARHQSVSGVPFMLPSANKVAGGCYKTISA